MGMYCMQQNICSQTHIQKDITKQGNTTVLSVDVILSIKMSFNDMRKDIEMSGNMSVANATRDSTWDPA